MDNIQLEQQIFNPNKPYQTRNGHRVYLIPLDNKYMGFIFTEDGDTCMSEWDLEGKRKTVYDRKVNEMHELDLINITNNE